MVIQPNGMIPAAIFPPVHRTSDGYERQSTAADSGYGDGDTGGRLHPGRRHQFWRFGANNAIDDVAGLRQNLGFALDDNVEHFARIEYTGSTDIGDLAGISQTVGFELNNTGWKS